MSVQLFLFLIHSHLPTLWEKPMWNFSINLAFQGILEISSLRAHTTYGVSPIQFRYRMLYT